MAPYRENSNTNELKEASAKRVLHRWPLHPAAITMVVMFFMVSVPPSNGTAATEPPSEVNPCLKTATITTMVDVTAKTTCTNLVSLVILYSDVSCAVR